MEAGQAPVERRDPVAGRACGSCMMCCKVLHVRAFDKPPGRWCSHAAQGTGCAIYGEHPDNCKSFYCLWMQNPKLGPEWKPDRARFLVSAPEHSANLIVGVDPSFPDAWKKPPYRAQILRWARAGAPLGQFVFVRTGMRVIVCLPDREVDLGTVDLDDQILATRRVMASGMAYDFKVERKLKANAVS